MIPFPTTRRGFIRLAFWILALLVLLAAVAMSGVVFAWVRFARTLPDLRGWHVTAPASEFRASDATPTYTFTDYLKQEDKVFGELDSLIKKDWAGESPGRFCRFKADSVCNPATILDWNWNRSRVREAKKPVGGALLIHGLSDAPYSLRSLSDRLYDAGYTVIDLRVPGHGTCPKALADSSWEDWAAAVRVAMVGLRERVPAGLPLIMVGYSNGGALSVNYATTLLMEAKSGKGAAPRPDALVLISPMIGITPLAEFTELYPLVSMMSGEKKLSWTGIEPEIDPFKYSSWPVNASLQAFRITRHVEETIGTLAADGRMKDFPPVLVVQSAADATVIAYRMIDVLMDRLPPGRGELILFDINRASWLQGLTDNTFEEHIRPRLKRADLPFILSLITNRSPDSTELIAKTLTNGKITDSEIGVPWPVGNFSLSHVALPIPASDPVYGAGGVESPSRLPLGTLALRGEGGVLAISPGLMMRMRFNPFYEWTENSIMRWVQGNVTKR